MFSADMGTTPSSSANYIEDVFSTYLYTGNGSTQTITNGIDLAGKGGLVWIKARGANGQSNNLYDTNRGVGLSIQTDSTNANTSWTGVSAFNADGFSLGSNSQTNFNNDPYASWTFRKQPKFFDVVTYTGTGSNKTVAHNLGSVPGCIIIKRTDSAGTNWVVYHKDLTSAAYALVLNGTLAQTSSPTSFNSTAPTSTVFSVGTSIATNASGGTYVAYIFAHNAGGFGLTGTDNVISCGSFTSDASDIATVNLGYEPQLVIMKAVSTTGHWWMADNMRGFTVNDEQYLLANSSGAEASGTNIRLTNTGFYQASTTGSATTYIYIAIRRGPMKVPTDGTKVFAPLALNNGFDTVNTTGFPVDLQIRGYRPGGAVAGRNPAVLDRLRGVSSVPSDVSSTFPLLCTAVTDAQNTSGQYANNWNNTGFSTALSLAGDNAMWNFRRAPSFFDEVCYTGTGTEVATNHNLGVVPELIITKCRSYSPSQWIVGSSADWSKYLVLNQTAAYGASTSYTSLTSTTYTPGSGLGLAWNGQTFVAYLFASCPGVSKVFSYTGNGGSQTIGCGFTAGARFVLIKRTDSTGDWYVWDTARGIVSGNDPHLSLNTTAAEVTTDDTIDPDSSGFVVNQLAATNCNVSGATYIGLAVA